MANGTQNFPSSLNPVGNMLTQPVIPVAGVQPQADPGLWKTFLANLAANPNLQQSLLTTGLSLIGDPLPGESGFGTFSRAALGGVQSYNRLNEIDRQRRLQEQGLALQERGLESLDESRKAQAEIGRERTGVMREGIAQRAEDSATRLQGLRERIDSDERIAKIRAAGMLGASGKQAGVKENYDRALAEALQSTYPEIYPAGDEGFKKALLVTSGIVPGNDPDSIARLATTMYTQMLPARQLFGDDPVEAQEQMIKEIQEVIKIFAPYDQIATQGPPEFNWDGYSFAGPGGEVKVVKSGDNQYHLVNAQGQQSKRAYTGDELKQLIGEK